MPRRCTTAGRSASSGWSSGSGSSVILSMGAGLNAKRRPGAAACVQRAGSAALARTLARIFLAAGVRAALQADLLAVPGGVGAAAWRRGLGGGLAVRFGDDLVAHEGSV